MSEISFKYDIFDNVHKRLVINNMQKFVFNLEEVQITPNAHIIKYIEIEFVEFVENTFAK
jgi:hypothetical protein